MGAAKSILENKGAKMKEIKNFIVEKKCKGCGKAELERYMKDGLCFVCSFSDFF